MKQVLQNLRTGETYISENPIPTPPPGTALVKTCTSLVSAGTERMMVDFASKSLLGKAQSRPDLVRQVMDKIRREGLLTAADTVLSRLDQPLALGYSSSGTIVALGKNISGFRVGQRVSCAGGGFAVHAEYAAVPKNLLCPIPENVDFESAAFTTLGSVALHGFRLSMPQLGDRIAVIGLGLLGSLTTQIALAAGCQVIGIDLDPARVRLAESLGVQAISRKDAEQAISIFTQGMGCDIVLICADSANADPVELAGGIARDKACVVAIGAVGQELPRRLYYEKELSFINSRSYGPGRYDPRYEEGGQDYPIGYVRWTENRNMVAFNDLLSQGKISVSPLITHRFPIQDAAHAYALITGKQKEPFLGVLLTYDPNISDLKTLAKSIPLLPIHNQAISPSANLVRLGVLGAGNFAQAVMLPALKKVKGIVPIGISSPSGIKAQHAGRQFHFSYATSDEMDIISDPNINTLAILTRHNLHVPLVIAGIQAGKHVFVEKPLVIHPDKLEQIESMLMTNGGAPDCPLLMVGFNRRFAPFSIKLKDVYQNRQEPMFIQYRVNAGLLPHDHWLYDPEQGGGRIIGEGCHFIDYLTFLVGSLPVSVHGHALPDTGRYHEDNVHLVFRFKDGSLGTITYLANGTKAFPKERVEVFCDGKIAVLDDFRSLEISQNGERHRYVSRLRQDKGYRAEWRAFSNAITITGVPPIPYDQLIGVAHATFAAVDALRNEKAVKI